MQLGECYWMSQKYSWFMGLFDVSVVEHQIQYWMCVVINFLDVHWTPRNCRNPCILKLIWISTVNLRKFWCWKGDIFHRSSSFWSTVPFILVMRSYGKCMMVNSNISLVIPLQQCNWNTIVELYRWHYFSLLCCFPNFLVIYVLLIYF